LLDLSWLLFLRSDFGGDGEVIVAGANGGFVAFRDFELLYLAGVVGLALLNHIGEVLILATIIQQLARSLELRLPQEQRLAEAPSPLPLASCFKNRVRREFVPEELFAVLDLGRLELELRVSSCFELFSLLLQL